MGPHTSREGREEDRDDSDHLFAHIANRLESAGVQDFGAHRCRHQWATLGARDGMTHYELCAEGGWKRGSRVPAQYVEEIPFEDLQRRTSPLTAFLRRKAS